MRLSGTVALVMGAQQGIGRAIAVARSSSGLTSPTLRRLRPW